jgi:hypothetical protein
VPVYRLIFPPPLDQSIESTHTSEIDSGDMVYAVGDEFEHEGKRWRVSKAPTEDPALGQMLDLMVWPAE